MATNEAGGLSSSEVQVKMLEAARSVATLPPNRWASWVVYLLEALEEHADRGDYRAMLYDVASDIDIWLEVGEW